MPIFFIIGRPRTGTTLFQSLFDAHPHVQIPWECQFVLNLYPRYGGITNWDEQLIRSFYNDLLQQWQFSAWNTDRDKLLIDLLGLQGCHTYTDICECVYLSHISFFPKENIRIIGDKNHGYTIYTDELKRLYPDAKFIFVLRDYRDNFDSIARVDFEIPSAALVVYKWRYFYKTALRAAKKYPGSFYFIRYEDLVREPYKNFKAICDFLNIPFTEDVFNFYKMKDKAAEVYPEDILNKHHSSLFNPINTSRLDLWKTSMSEHKVRVADFVAGKYASMAGYERKYTEFGISTVIKSLPGVVYAKLLYLATDIIDHFPYKFRATILNKGPLWLATNIGRHFKRK